MMRKAMPEMRGERERGFSLMELMVALIILGVITSQMFIVLSTQKEVATTQVRDLDLQESARLIADMIAFDARNGGMMVPREAAVSAVDGGDVDPDRFCTAATDYFRVRDDPVWNNQESRFDSIPTVDLADPQHPVLTDLDVDDDLPANDWNPGGDPNNVPEVGIIIAQTDGRGSHCARVVAQNALTFTLATGHAPQVASTPTAGKLTLQTTPYKMIAVPAVVYELEDADGTGSGTLSSLRRNGKVMSTEVEDLQIEFWVDTLGGQTPNGVVDPNEFPIHNLKNLAAPPAGSPAGAPLSTIRNLRISLVARSLSADEGGAQIKRHTRPGLANRDAATASDEFTRRIYTISVLPRNLL
jgi:prepilin-type N-terminal cleavage/methylation domain-containing protein